MVVIVDYGVGNLASIANMGRKAGGQLTVSSDPRVIAAADKLILPGVGAFDAGMARLRERELIPVLNQRVLENGVPILGLCLGLQLFGRGSEEGHSAGLGWVAADTRKFEMSATAGLKIPHMGWNYIEPHKTGTLLEGLPPQSRFYFVHSFHLVCDDESDVLSWTTHGYRFVSGLQRRNIHGTQFHPEKSHKYGLAVIRNFLSLS